MTTFGQKVIEFYENLVRPSVPAEVEVLFPFESAGVSHIVDAFYSKYFNDHKPRTFLIGINPGRFGGGATGIPFTDPERLRENCQIPHPFEGASELSSRFIYTMIDRLGGPVSFYRKFYFTSVSPLGFVQEGRNLNYYDSKALQDQLEPYMVETLRTQIGFGARPVAFSLGMGKNIAYLQYLNDTYRLFEEIRPLPHPRWIMQYRLKRLEEFLQLYHKELSAADG